MTKMTIELDPHELALLQVLATHEKHSVQDQALIEIQKAIGTWPPKALRPVDLRAQVKKAAPVPVGHVALETTAHDVRA